MRVVSDAVFADHGQAKYRSVARRRRGDTRVCRTLLALLATFLTAFFVQTVALISARELSFQVSDLLGVVLRVFERAGASTGNCLALVRVPGGTLLCPQGEALLTSARVLGGVERHLCAGVPGLCLRSTGSPAGVRAGVARALFVYALAPGVAARRYDLRIDDIARVAGRPRERGDEQRSYDYEEREQLNSRARRSSHAAISCIVKEEFATRSL
jgi:hypothetical protein